MDHGAQTYLVKNQENNIASMDIKKVSKDLFVRHILRTYLMLEPNPM
jgi:hypothetical protein